MSEEPPAKKLRKGTSSCLECRLRKVKCVWTSDGAGCEGCRGRQAPCRQQTEAIPTTDTGKSTSRARIEHLENSVSALWSTVRTLEAKLGSVPATAPQLQPSSTQANTGHGNRADETDSSGSQSPRLSTNIPPSHLLQLFDNGIIGSYDDGFATPHKKSSDAQRKSQDMYDLQKLLPSREDMLVISTHASSWLHLYNSLFPLKNLISTSDEILPQYDKMKQGSSDVSSVASLLLHVAITVNQAPEDTSGCAVKSIGDASKFIKDVSDTVERIIVSNDTVAGTVEGIETSLLYLRLQLGRADVKKMWLLSRRIIGLAELSGLQRASLAVTSLQKPGMPEMQTANLASKHRKAEVWESICAIDRISSMMWSLPLGTSNFPLPKRPLLDANGQLIPQSLMYRLAEIASRILDLEHIHVSGRPRTELFNAVMNTDQELRTLALGVPKNWWRVDWPSLSVDIILQYWYQYLTVRIHLQLALAYDENHQFAFNFVTCLDACQELVRRYVVMRPILPVGFFANRIIDLQAFTGAVFLLLASHRSVPSSGLLPQSVDIDSVTRLTDDVLQMMEFAAGRVGGDVARQAADAVRSLSSLLQESQTSNAQQITLNLPLVGRIHVSRKTSSTATTAGSSHRATNHQSSHDHIKTTFNGGFALTPQESPVQPSDYDMMDSLTFSMDVPDAYPFLTDEPFENEQWLTWTQ